MSKLLISYSDNWADEMDIDGFVIKEEKEWKEIEKSLKAFKKSIFVGFGTNEDNEYRNGKNFLETIEVEKITDEEYKILKKFFPSERYGNTGFEYAFEQILETEDDE